MKAEEQTYTSILVIDPPENKGQVSGIKRSSMCPPEIGAKISDSSFGRKSSDRAKK
jgi:hypothetical protein